MSKRRFFINTRYFNSILHNKPILLAFRGLEDYTLLHFSCPQSFFLLSLQREHPERIPNGSRTKRSSGSWFSRLFARLFLDRSSIVSRSFFVRPSMVLRSTIVHPSFSLRSFFDCRTKIYRRNSEQQAKLLLRHYGGETN